MEAAFHIGCFRAIPVVGSGDRIGYIYFMSKEIPGVLYPDITLYVEGHMVPLACVVHDNVLDGVLML